MSIVAAGLAAVALVLGCLYEPVPVARPRTWRSSSLLPLATSLVCLAAVLLLATEAAR